MAFTKDIRALTISNLQEIRNIDKLIQQLKDLEQKQVYTKEYVEREISTLKEERSRIVREGKEKVTQMADDYRARIREEFMPKPEDITADGALFTSGIILTESQLETLADRYADNMTMTQLIFDHAESRGIHLHRQRATEKARTSIADNMLHYYSSAMQRPDFPEWESEEYFENLTGGAED